MERLFSTDFSIALLSFIRNFYSSSFHPIYPFQAIVDRRTYAILSAINNSWFAKTLNYESLPYEGIVENKPFTQGQYVLLPSPYPDRGTLVSTDVSVVLLLLIRNFYPFLVSRLSILVSRFIPFIRYRQSVIEGHMLPRAESRITVREALNEALTKEQQLIRKEIKWQIIGLRRNTTQKALHTITPPDSIIRPT